MGWRFEYGMSRRRLIDDLTSNRSDAQQETVCLARAVRGNVLWSVWERRGNDGKPSDRRINCDVLRYEKDYGWGHKPMEESMGPVYYTCPLSFLDMAPPTNEAWRAAVRVRAAKQQAQRRLKHRLVVGQTVRLDNRAVPEVTLVRLKPLIGAYGGVRYRIRWSDLAPPESPLVEAA